MLTLWSILAIDLMQDHYGIVVRIKEWNHDAMMRTNLNNPTQKIYS